MDVVNLISLASRLESAGLSWEPEIGDEVIDKLDRKKVGILVDPQGLSLDDLRQSFLWVPNIEQLILEIENRNAIIFHAGSSASHDYDVVLKTVSGLIKGEGSDFRLALGDALENLLSESHRVELH